MNDDKVSYESYRDARERAIKAEAMLDDLRRVDQKFRTLLVAARKCVEWTEKHDHGRCIHGVLNQDCRGCANEPSHFPMGIDEYLDLRSAVRDLERP
jgi:hypothetical protein